MNTYGIIVIGCGHIGESHIEKFYYKDNIRIIGVVDLDESKARLFAKKYGALSWNTDYRPYLTDPRVDIVVVATYIDSHISILRDCFRHKKHILCEKPVVSSLTEMDELEELVKAYPQVKLLTGHILRHNKTYQTAANLIAEGKLGKPYLFRMVQNHHSMDWERYKKLLSYSSPVFDCGVHYFDVMQWFSGASIVSVRGMGSRIDEDLPEDVLNHGIVFVTLSDGSKGYYEAGWSRNLAAENMKEVVGTLGSMRIILARDRLTHKENGDLIEWCESETGEYRQINVQADYKPMDDQLFCLIKMIEEPEYPGTPTFEETVSAFKVACAADMAIRENKTWTWDEATQSFQTV